MRLLLTLAAVASLAACHHNTDTETGRVSPADTSKTVTRTGADTSKASSDTSITRFKSDTSKGGFDTTKTSPTRPDSLTRPDSMKSLRHDSM